MAHMGLPPQPEHDADLKMGKVAVALHMLCNAVNDLYDHTNGRQGRPLYTVDTPLAVGSK